MPVTLRERRDRARGDDVTVAWVPATSLPAATQSERYQKPIMGPRFDRKATLIVRDNTGGDRGTISQQFILQGYSRNANEQMQIVQHTEGWNLFFQRSKPTIWTFSGMLYEGPQEFAWNNAFIELYETRLKGSVAAAQQYGVSLIFAGTLVSGYLFHLHIGGSAERDTIAQFSFSMVGISDARIVDAPIEEAA